MPSPVKITVTLSLWGPRLAQSVECQTLYLSQTGGHGFNPRLRKATGTTQENYRHHVYSPISVINNQKRVEKAIN